MKTIKSINSTLTCLAVAALLSGCASNTYDKGAKTASSIQKAATGIENTRAQVGGVMTALNALVSRPESDLKPQFKQFQSEVSRLDSMSKDLENKYTAMDARGDAYFEQWDKDIAAIQNEDIRSRSQARREEVAAHFEKIKVSYGDAKEAFQPFMSDIRDIETALKADLTPGGIEAIKDVKQQATKNAVPLRDALTKLADDFSALGVAMSSTTPQPAK